VHRTRTTPQVLRAYPSVARVLAFILVCSTLGWGFYSYLRTYRSPAVVTRLEQNSANAADPKSDASATNQDATLLRDLPPLPQTTRGPNRWDMIEGLQATPVEKLASPATGQSVLRLRALPEEGRHVISAHFTGLAPESVYRVFTWVRSVSTNRIMIEARDSVAPGTDKAWNYGMAQFDMADRSVIKSSGDLIAQGVDQADDGWLRVWGDLRTRDGQVFVVLGLLESPRNLHVFRGVGQELIFGGFEAARH